MLLVRPEPDDVARYDLLDGAALALNPTASERDDQRLAKGGVCQAVRALGSKVTLAIATRAGSGALWRGSIRTVPVNQSVGPAPEGDFRYV